PPYQTKFKMRSPIQGSDLFIASSRFDADDKQIIQPNKFFTTKIPKEALPKKRFRATFHNDAFIVDKPFHSLVCSASTAQ
ncbi:hypothetical protein ABI052_14930, partial [Enterococcus faecium]|uniref:hypothetical protein n=1 Tax=Enterococcus faecium TaxID=1352 RepID=UPI003F4400FE